MIGVDWGTTSLRGYLIEEEQLIAKRALPYGVLKVPNGDFKAVFDELTQGWSGTVLMSGMVGSSKGWINTPYIQAPLALSDLHKHLIELSHLTERPTWLVPGVQQLSPEDVMRGEELQALGATCSNGSELLILCGTHSKHVHLKDGRMLSFSTYMTGELYAILQSHSILSEEECTDDGAFLEGVEASQADGQLLNKLFQIRAKRLNKTLLSAPPYLSGLLIGSELKSVDQSNVCTIVGTKQLCKLYFDALQWLFPRAQIKLMTAEEASIKGLVHIARSMNV